MSPQSNSRPLEVSRSYEPVAVIHHRDGFMRLFLDEAGQLYAEVNGFRTEQGRAFLNALEQFADVGPDICCSLIWPESCLGPDRHFIRNP